MRLQQFPSKDIEITYEMEHENAIGIELIFSTYTQLFYLFRTTGVLNPLEVMHVLAKENQEGYCWDCIEMKMEHQDNNYHITAKFLFLYDLATFDLRIENHAK